MAEQKETKVSIELENWKVTCWRIFDGSLHFALSVSVYLLVTHTSESCLKSGSFCHQPVTSFDCLASEPLDDPIQAFSR